MDGRIGLLLEAVDRAYSKRAWHGTTLKGALRGLSPEAALFRVAPGRRSIWELLLHVAYWKYIVRRAISGKDGPTFPRSPSNWPRVPAEPTPRALRADLAMLQREHDLLREAIRRFPPSRLGERAAMILGAAAHDTHHTGQIQLLKRLAAGA